MVSIAKTHLTLGIYPDKSFKFNVVEDVDLELHISYNKERRPGRLLYVDGKRVHDGCIKEEYLPEYDEIAKNFYANSHSIDMDIPTIPYQ